MKRLLCILTGHQRWTRFSDSGAIGAVRYEWSFPDGSRSFMSVCSYCGVLLEEGDARGEKAYLSVQRTAWYRP